MLETERMVTDLGSISTITLLASSSGERPVSVINCFPFFKDALAECSNCAPVMYTVTFSIELAIYASNTEQSQQILEQIMMIFDPSIQIQTTDANFDWTKLTTVELTAINSERNYPIGTDKRMTIWSLTFAVPIYISPPMDIRHDIVHDIFIRIGEMSEAGVLEFDEEGILVPYTDLWTTVHVDGDNL